MPQMMPDDRGRAANRPDFSFLTRLDSVLMPMPCWLRRRTNAASGIVPK